MRVPSKIILRLGKVGQYTGLVHLSKNAGSRGGVLRHEAPAVLGNVL